jgi:excinuclease ABC subunit A
LVFRVEHHHAVHDEVVCVGIGRQNFGSVGPCSIGFVGDPAVARPLSMVREVGLGYCASVNQRPCCLVVRRNALSWRPSCNESSAGQTLYILDEPTTGPHPSDVERLIVQLNRLVSVGNTVIVIEHDMAVVVECDWVIDIGPGAGEEGGRLVAQGTPETLAETKGSRTATDLRRFIDART